MLKVMMFNKLYGPSLGGVERVVYDICEEIKNKVELTVLCANTKPFTEIEHRDKYKVIKSASAGRILSSVHLGLATPWWWLKTKNNILHFHFPSPIAEAYCLALYPRKKPLIVSYHADISGYNKALFFYAPILKKFLKRADRIIISSPALLERSPFLRDLKDKCVIIPFGIDVGRFELSSEDKEAFLGLREKFPGRIVLFVGRL
ncbi:MAG: glycosyltransferase, partial [Candidatus Omnitrophica bacterium]|nr:glycosyltransferase [Candidatus Omnitrophota bacterium]